MPNLEQHLFNWICLDRFQWIRVGHWLGFDLQLQLSAVWNTGSSIVRHYKGEVKNSMEPVFVEAVTGKVM